MLTQISTKFQNTFRSIFVYKRQKRWEYFFSNYFQAPGRGETRNYCWGPEEPLISPKEAPESSWLVNESAEELKEDEASDDLIDLEDEEDGENDKGANPWSLKYGCNKASLAVMRSLGEKHSIF